MALLNRNRHVVLTLRLLEGGCRLRQEEPTGPETKNCFYFSLPVPQSYFHRNPPPQRLHLVLLEVLRCDPADPFKTETEKVCVPVLPSVLKQNISRGGSGRQPNGLLVG